MRTITGQFFESKVRLERITENGEQCKVNELYVINAMSFTETESKITKYISQYVSGESEVLTEKMAKYNEVMFSDKEGEDVFFNVSLAFITLNEKTGKEKRSKVDYLVQASNVETARRNVEEVMNGTMIDYRILGITESAIIDYVE